MTAPATMSAREKVFGPWELVEHILLFLPLRRLLLAQKINKATFDVLASSTGIRRALFFKPTSPPAKLIWDEDFEGPLYKVQENTIFKPVEPIVNAFLTITRIGISDLDDQMGKIVEAEQSAFCRVGDGPISTYACRRAHGNLPFSTQSRDHMLLTHPPLEELHPFQANGVVIDEDLEVESKSGITHGDLLAECSSSWTKESPGMLSGNDREGNLGEDHVVPEVFDLEEALSWKRLLGTVDSITGHEMLGILGEESADLGDELHDDLEDNSDSDFGYDGLEDFVVYDDSDESEVSSDEEEGDD